MQKSLHKKNILFIALTLLLVICSFFMFCGCNTTQTVSTTTMKNAYNNFVQKLENFDINNEVINNTIETDKETPSEPSETSQTILNIPDDKYVDIDLSDYKIDQEIFYVETFIPEFTKGYIAPIQNAMNLSTTSFNLTNVYIENGDVNYTAICYFDFDQKTETLIADYICIPKHDNTQNGTLHTKLLLTISNENWTKATIYYITTGNSNGGNEGYMVLVGMINDTQDNQKLQSFYRLQKSITTDYISSSAIEFNTKKIAVNLEYDWLTDSEKTELFDKLFPYKNTMLQYHDFIQIPIG